MKLIDVCDFQGGSQPPKEEWAFEEQDGYIRMLQIRDFTQSEKVIPEYIKVSNSTKTCEVDDILIARYGASIGKILTGLAGAYNVAIMRTVPDTSKVQKRYLYYYLKSPYFQNAILNVGSRAAQAGFNKEDLSKLEIKCPALIDQGEIVSVLEKVESVIQKRKQELQLLDNLIKARFVEMFGNILCDSNLPVIQLKKLADIGSSKRIYANEYVESGVPFYRSKEIRELGTGMKPSVELFIKQERYDEIKEKYGVPKVGDILIAAIGATIGYSWIVDSENPFYYKDGNIIILSIKDNVNPIFLNHTMRILIDDFKNKGVAGSAQLALTIEKLEKMMVINPPIELQNRFADFVRAIDKSKVKVQKALDETQKLFDSLMQQYFG